MYLTDIYKIKKEPGKASLQQYNYKLKQLDKLNIDYINNPVGPDDIKKYFPINSFVVVRNALIYFYRKNNENGKYNKIIEQLYDSGRKSNLLPMLEEANKDRSTKKETSFIEWDKIMDVYYEHAAKFNEPYILKQNKNDYLNFLLLSAFLLMPPRRTKDYSRLKYHNFKNLDDFQTFLKYIVNDESNTFNFFIKIPDVPPFFLFCVYKTKATYGIQKIYVGQELINIIEKYNNNGFIGDDNIITNFYGKKTRKRLYSIFDLYDNTKNKAIDINTLRHSFITYYKNNHELFNKKNRKIVSIMMGHSDELQGDYYVERNKILNNDTIVINKKYPIEKYIENNLKLAYK